MSARRVKADTAMGSEHRDRTAHRQRRAAHPIPACRIVAVTLPPALDSAFMVSLIAATGVVNAA
jgi:hypothetical protein